MSEKKEYGWEKIGWANNLLNFGIYILKPRRKQLELKQTDIANKIGVNQSRISAYENKGSYPRGIREINRLLDAYQLPNQYRENYLRLCTGLPNIHIRDRSKEELTTEEFIIKKDKEIARIKTLIDSGSTQLASKWLEDEILPSLWKKTKELIEKNDIETSRLIKRLTDSIHFNLDCKSVWMSKKDSINVLLSGKENLKSIHELTDDPYTLLVSYILDSSANYLRGNNKYVVQNAEHTQNIIEDKKILDPYLIWQNLSLWAVCCAKSGFYELANEPIKKFEDYMNKYEVDPLIYRQYLETSARIEGLTKSQLFWKKQEEAKDLEFGPEGIPKEPYTATLMLRNEIEAMIIFKDLSKSRMINLFNQAKLISGNNYARLLEEIEEKIIKV